MRPCPRASTPATTAQGCGTCGHGGHNSRTCPRTAPPATTAQSCGTCGRSGHNARTCTNAATAAAPARRSGGAAAAAAAAESQKCQRCVTIAHVSPEDCPYYARMASIDKLYALRLKPKSAWTARERKEEERLKQILRDDLAADPARDAMLADKRAVQVVGVFERVGPEMDAEDVVRFRAKMAKKGKRTGNKDKDTDATHHYSYETAQHDYAQRDDKSKKMTVTEAIILAESMNEEGNMTVKNRYGPGGNVPYGDERDDGTDDRTLDSALAQQLAVASAAMQQRLAEQREGAATVCLPEAMRSQVQQRLGTGGAAAERSPNTNRAGTYATDIVNNLDKLSIRDP